MDRETLIKKALAKQELDRRRLAEKCRQSFFKFIQEFWGVIIQEEFKANWHISYLCEELERVADWIVNRKPKEYDLIINIPPGTTKSTIVTVMFHPWVWTIDPSIRFISNSYSETLSLEHAIKSRDIIQSKNTNIYFLTFN